MIHRRYGRAVRREPGKMNRLEAAYAHYLEGLKRAGEIQSYAFDVLKLRIAPKTFYEPDFLVVGKDWEVEIHEVKGTTRDKRTKAAGPFVEDDAAVKIKVAADKFQFRFKLVWNEEGRWMERFYE